MTSASDAWILGCATTGSSPQRRPCQPPADRARSPGSTRRPPGLRRSGSGRPDRRPCSRSSKQRAAVSPSMSVRIRARPSRRCRRRRARRRRGHARGRVAGLTVKNRTAGASTPARERTSCTSPAQCGSRSGWQTSAALRGRARGAGLRAARATANAGRDRDRRPGGARARARARAVRAMDARAGRASPPHGPRAVRAARQRLLSDLAGRARDALRRPSSRRASRSCRGA